MNFNQIKFGRPSIYIDGIGGLTPAQISSSFTARVISNGGSLTTIEQNAILALVTNLQASNIWNSMKAIYPMVGSTANSCAVNLVDANFTGAFSSGWYYDNTGATPNGFNSYMTTGFIPSIELDPYNTSLSYYSRTNSPTDGYEIGAQNGFTITDRIGFTIYYGGNFQANQNNFDVSGTVLVANPNTLGMYIVSRTSTTMHKAFRNGVQLGATNTNIMTTPLPTSAVTVGALNFNDPVNFVSTSRQCAFSHIGLGLSDAQAINMYTHVQTFQTSLSRNT